MSLPYSSFFAFSLLGSVLVSAAAAGEVNIYTTREAALLRPLTESYSKATGTKINVVYMKDGMAERVVAEGDSSPADLLMAVDAGNLIDVVNKGLAQPITSENIKTAVPEQFRGANGEWIGLSWRARVIYAAKDLPLNALHYEDLAKPEWKGRICIRSGQHPYNTALTAAFIAHHGKEHAESWLTGLHANLARKASGGDRDVAKDILGGICEIGIGNSYYVGLMRSGQGGPEQLPWGEAIKVILPTFEGGGTHGNISGAVLAKHAPNKDEAVKFLEYLVSEEAQKIYAQSNFEYPVREGAAVDPIIASFGAITLDPLPFTEIVKHRAEASELTDKVGFDN